MVSKGIFSLSIGESPVGKGTSNYASVFFQEGVTHGNAFLYPATDEFNLQHAWQCLAQDYQVPLHLCVAAAQRRGVVEPLTSSTTQQNNLASCFVLAGLGEFMKASLEADRVVCL